MDVTADIQAGSTLSTTFAGTATHGGGSCQWSLSYDNGNSWNVIHSQVGGCMTDSTNIDVPIPSSAPSGQALFGWTWFNRQGMSRLFDSSFGYRS